MSEKWRKTAALVKYQIRIYSKENRFLMPLIVMLILLCFMYSMSPVGVVNSFAMNCYIIFLLMAWVGFSVAALEDPVIEQIQMLRIGSILCYYTSKILFVLVLSMAGTCICLIFSVAADIVYRGSLFSRQLTAYDLCHAFLLLLGSSFAGGTLGSICHPMVMRERKMALLLTVLAAVSTIIKSALVREISCLKYLVWILPPVEDVMKDYGHAAVFTWPQTGKIFLLLMIYGALYSVIKSAVSDKRRFG